MSVAVMKAPLQIPPHLRPGYQSLLSETAHILLKDGDADALCRRVFETLCDSIEIDCYSHYLVSADGSHLELASAGGSEAVRKALGPRLNFGKAVCGHVAQTREPIYLPHIQNRRDEMTRLIRECGVRCYVCQPLISQASLIGTMSFGSNRRSEFLADEIEILSLVTHQVQIATERRLQNEHLRRLEQLAAAGRMCATLAHEINNPLASLSNLLYLLKDEIADEEGKELLSRADDQIARLTEISQRTLMQFRHTQQRPTRVNLTKTVNEVFSNICLPNHVHSRRYIEEELYVELIPGEMRQVLFNLLINAAQFSTAGQVVTLTVRRLGSCAQIVVRDEGRGIDESRRPHLFKPFYTTRTDGGTGIGLWISREMIERIGGTLDYKSAPAISPGTEFIITLPLAGSGSTTTDCVAAQPPFQLSQAGNASLAGSPT